MSRPDLLALTPEALVRLANAGLVKRAQKEVDGGAVSDVHELADGTVVATSRDGATTRLPPKVTLQAAPCTCGASTVCRHRLAAVLAYQRHVGATEVPAAPWDPGEFTEDEVAATCGAAVAIADRLVIAGVTVAIEPMNAAMPPVARLPMATVMFLVPRSLAFAKCDCSKASGCEHVVLAVRGFRQRPDGGLAVLGAPSVPSAMTGPRAAIERWAAQICQYGVTAPGSAEVTQEVRALAIRERWAWIADACEDYERTVERFAAAKASFRADELAALVGELLVRGRVAATDASGFRPSWVLGRDAPSDVAMEKVRLVSLGCRFVADDDRRLATLYFVDPDTATVLALTKLWPGEQRNGAELARLFASSRMAISELVQGELVTRAARRKANGALDLSASRGMQSSLLPATDNFDALPEPLLVRDLRAHARRRADGPPAVMMPRQIGHDVCVVAIATVEEVTVSPDGQELVAVVADAAGTELTLRCDFESVCPGAVDTLAVALAEGPRFVAGRLEAGAHGWSMRPLSIYTDRLVVLDVAPSTRTSSPALTSASPDDEPPDPLTALRRSWHDLLETALLQGARAAAPLAQRAAIGAEALAMTGLASRFAAAGRGEVTALLDLLALAALTPHVDLARLADARA